VVHDAAEAGEDMSRVTSTRVRLGGAVAVAVLVVIALVVIRTRGEEAPAVASPAVNGTIRLATCQDWNRATAPRRFGTLRVLAYLSAGRVPGRPELRGPALDDQQAYDILERSCAPPLATAFKLYKLYDRSAAFVGH
jgi:hypothetical protein